MHMSDIAERSCVQYENKWSQHWALGNTEPKPGLTWWPARQVNALLAVRWVGVKPLERYLSYSVAALGMLQGNVVVDDVKRHTPVEQNEDDGLALVDGAQRVVGDSDERSLSTVVGTIHWLHRLLHPIFLDVLQ